MRRVSVFVWAALLAFGFVVRGNAQAERVAELPIENRRVSVLGLARALCDAYGLSGDELSFPDFEFVVSGATGVLTVGAINRALGGVVRLERVERGGKLAVDVDRTRLRVARRAAKEKLAGLLGRLTGRDLLARRYTLSLPEAVSDGEPYVIAVHGMDSSPAAFDALAEFLAQQSPSIDLGWFEYANDEAVDRIAEEFAKRLASLRVEQPKRRVVLVCHSMGGLVGRYVVETPALDPGNVSKLIMLGTPNHGSRLARLRPGVDVLAFTRGLARREELLSTFLDGLGEAGFDLWPGSPLLRELNARERNAAVQYRLLLGTRGPTSRATLRAARESLVPELHPLYRDKLGGWLDDLDELVDGAGDGAVSVRRGRLAGVDTVLESVSHRGMLRGRTVGSRRVFERVYEWVRAR